MLDAFDRQPGIVHAEAVEQQHQQLLVHLAAGMGLDAVDRTVQDGLKRRVGAQLSFQPAGEVADPSNAAAQVMCAAGWRNAARGKTRLILGYGPAVSAQPYMLTSGYSFR